MGGLPMNNPGLYACLYAKELPAQAMLRLRPELREQSCAVLEGEPPTQYVCSCNTKARLAGVSHGMTRVELETIPYVQVLLRSLVEEDIAKAAMLECAGAFSPSVEDQSSNGAFLCVIDIAGTGMLHGTPSELGKSLLNRIRTLGITSSVAIASNFHASISLARGMSARNRLIIVPPGEESKALAPISLKVLDLSEDHVETFFLWGIETLGMLAALPERSLIARMGQEGKRLQQLAAGTLAHLFVPIERPFILEEFIEFDSPVEILDSLLFVLGAMLEQLIIRATNRVVALSSVTVMLFLEGGASHSRTVRPALPTNDRKLWLKLLHLDLEAHPPNAAILSLRLTAESGNPSKVQLGLFSPQLPEASRLDITLARIRAIVGEECVGSPLLTDTHRPDTFQIKPFEVVAPSDAVPTGYPLKAALRQIRPAENITVTLSNQRPILFFFRAERYEVKEAYGPWMASGDWWNQTRWGVQQWDLIARSRAGIVLCCCIVRDQTLRCWQMVALYD
jgi:protein ImuB